MRPQRVLGYCRVSSREQADRTSLDTQKAALARYCAENGYPAPIVRVDVESGSAERAEARTKQQELIEDVRRGDLVLVLDQDRWSRDTIHFLSSAASLDEIDRLHKVVGALLGDHSGAYERAHKAYERASKGHEALSRAAFPSVHRAIDEAKTGEETKP